MISLQNPSIPVQQDPVEIDRVIVDLQTVLSNQLPWLTQPYGRAYKNLDVSNGTRFYYPQVYIGKDRGNPKYFTVTPDNDKQGQCFFLVERESLSEQQQGQYGFLSYNVSVIFSVNLELINSALLETDLFTANLVKDVREVLRQNLGKEYQLRITTIDYLMERVFAGLNVETQTIEKAPLQHFRLNATVLLPEDCSDLPYNSCDVLLANLTEDQRNNCILPSYDFSNTVTQDATTAQQQIDLSAWLCGTAPEVNRSLILNGINQYLYSPVTPVYDFEYNTPFTLSCWVKIETLKSLNIFNHIDATTGRGYFLFMNTNGGLQFDLRSNGSTRLSVASPNSAVSMSQWHHISITYDGSVTTSGLDIYLDGVALAKPTTFNNLGTNSIKAPSLPLVIGAAQLGSVNLLDGLVDEVRIWNKALSPAQILAEFNGKGSTSPVEPLSLIGQTDINNAQYGAIDFFVPDSSGTVTGFQTKNVLSTGLSLDVPL